MTKEEAISRQAVIYYIRGHIHEIISESGIDKNEHTNRVLRAIMNGVETMPPVNPQTRWIPVSERLPEEHKDVLTCGLGGFIEIQSFENAYDGYWENQNGAWSDLDDVVAWMPLPEPYKAESEDKG